MRNYIILNGTNSNTISGLLIQSLAPISKPLMRTETEEIDGRDGDIITPLGFSAYDKEITVGLYGDFDINEVIAFFNSEGTVIFSNEPDKYYNYQIINQIDFDRLVRYRTATVTFHIQPFKFATTGETQTLSGGDPVSDEGTNLVLDGSAEAPFNRLDLKGNSEQTTYSGKNLARNAYQSPQTISGVTFTSNADGTITANGTATAGINFYPSGSSSTYLIPQGTYTLSAGVATSDSTYFVLTDVVGSSIYWDSRSSVRQTQTVPAGGLDIALRIVVRSGQTLNNVVFKIQLESGSSATSFEKYVGGTPAPNPEFPMPISTVTGEQTVSVVGKNLLTLDGTFERKYPANLEFTQTPNSVVITANTTTGSQYVRFQTSELDATQTYNLSFKAKKIVKGTDGYPAISVLVYGSNDKTNLTNLGNIGSAKDDPTQGVEYSFSRTLTGYKFYYIAFYNNTSTPVSSGEQTEYYDIQLELGSQASDYQPYESQEFEINLGKNLFGGLTLDHAEYCSYTLDGLTLTITPQNTTSNTAVYFKLGTPIEAGTYTLNSQTSLSSSTQLRTASNAVAYNFANGYADRTFTTTATATMIAFNWLSTGSTAPFTVDLSTLQIERGSQATSYASYFTPIELAKIGDDQDYIWNDAGVWKIHRAIGKTIYTGAADEYWQYVSGDHARFTIANSYVAIVSSSGVVGAVMSDYFTPASVGDIYMGQDCSIGIHNTIQQFWISYHAITTVESFKTWLASNPTTVYYALAEPVDEEITNENLISQLDAIDSEAHAYKGRTHITSLAATGNAPHIIAAEVVADASGTITNAGNIYSKPKLTVYGTGNIGIYLNGVQMFQVALGSDGYITIDTNLMEAYKDNLQTLKNRQVTGDYSNFKLPVGANTISFSGSVTQCIVENFSRWL